MPVGGNSHTNIDEFLGNHTEVAVREPAKIKCCPVISFHVRPQGY